MTAPLARRRLLAIAAAAAVAGPGRVPAAAPVEWRGSALGAEARVTLAGATPETARHVLPRIAAALTAVEADFSLFRDSALVRLNRSGRLPRPDPEVRALFDLAGRVHAATGGAFDPTVQPLWRALATGGDAAAARARVGWDRVRIGAEAIALDPGMELTFNGIAQGAAADRVAAVLRAEGFRDVLIDAGEILALGGRPGGGPWRAAVAGPDGIEAARVPLADMALATSSPAGTLIGAGLGHILDPRSDAPPHWRLVSVAAPSAALADALSTAFCLMGRAEIDTALAAFPEARLVALA